MNCWDCKYHKITGDTFLGQCAWFWTIGKDPKDIPSSIIDEGCEYFEKGNGHPLKGEIMKRFQGTLFDD